MAQFTVYRNTGPNKQAYPYFIDVQNDFLRMLNTRLVMPLSEKNTANSQVKQLTPTLSINGKDYVVLANMLSTTDVQNLREQDAITSVPELRGDIVAAIDMLISGY